MRYVKLALVPFAILVSFICWIFGADNFERRFLEWWD